MKPFAATILALVILIVAGALGIGVFVYSGAYDIGADVHHTRPVQVLLRTLRQRSIEVRAKDIAVPDLDDAQRILAGAGQYAAMCTGCHLAPGMRDSEIRPGLYPQPPNLSKARLDPRAAFWVIKHGIKMSAMPAWGFSHDDATIWSMVAFLRKLPTLTPAQYQDIVARAPPDEDMGDASAPASGPAAAMSAMPRAGATPAVALPPVAADTRDHDRPPDHDHHGSVTPAQPSPHMPAGIP